MTSLVPKVYVAGYYMHQEPVRAMQQALRKQGWEITHDWTSESTYGMAGEDLSRHLRGCACQDYEGVLDADLLVVMHEAEGGCRMWTEMGLAIGHSIPVIAVGAHVPVRPGMEILRNIFYYLPRVYVVKDVEEALAKALTIKEML